MNKEAIGTGKTVEEALENAYRELGVGRENADFEILERPKRSLFGLRVTPARVRVFVEVEEPKPAPVPVKPAPAPVKTTTSVRPAAPLEKAPATPPRTEEPRREPKEFREPKPRIVTEAKAADKPLETADAAAKPEVPYDPVAIQAKVNCAREYLQSIFEKMGLDTVEIKVVEREESAVFTLSGEGLGVLIGRRGETLDALQYLSGLVANRLEGGYFRVTIDSGNYREKREKTLEQLARKLSAQVIKTGRNLTLEPMNPYERRIIHSAVQTIEGVSSSSIGEEPNRRVVISSTAPRKKYPPRQGQKPRTPRPAAATTGESKERMDKPPMDRPARPAGEGNNRNRRPFQNNNRRGPASSGIITRPNAFGENAQPTKKIDDSAYEIEQPVRTVSAPKPIAKPVPKVDAPTEIKDKPLYSKIDID